MPPREVTLLAVRLDAMARASLALALQLEDLHALAYDKATRDSEKVATGGERPAGVENVGDERARDVWRRLGRIPFLEKELLALERAAGNLLSEGASPSATRGSLISRGELSLALRRQRQRQRLGEYTPKRNEDQPDYPGGRRS